MLEQYRGVIRARFLIFIAGRGWLIGAKGKLWITLLNHVLGMQSALLQIKVSTVLRD